MAERNHRRQPLTFTDTKMTNMQKPIAATGPAGLQPCTDLHEHLKVLDEAGLLITIDEPINKDTEMHPLVRWQFRGGIPEARRKAFLFTNVVDGSGKRYDMPVVIGALAASAEIYRIGMGVETVADIGAKWSKAISNPIAPRTVEHGACQEVVISGAELKRPGKGLDALPIPISTPGFDVAPYLTATNVITRDPQTLVQNVGTYRGCLRSPTRLGMMMLVSLRAGGQTHWQKYRALGQKMPIAIVLGSAPAMAFCGPQKLREDLDEMSVAGALLGKPVDMVRAKTVDLMVPADAEIIIEGLVDTDFLEPEGPFGESHGHVALEDFNMNIEVTAITHKRKPILSSIISQVTPSESSVIKRVAYEPMFLAHLRDTLGIKGVAKVSLHEPLTNLRRVIIIQVKRNTPTTEVWRALHGATTLQASCGKYVIAVNEDIDPDNGDSIFWALSYRSNPELDTHIIKHRERGHGPRTDTRGAFDSSLLVDATMKEDMPPLALPKREYMENAKALWERLGLPELKPEAPWFGYSLGDWSEEWDAAAQRAVDGNYEENGRRSARRRRRNVEPNTPVREATNTQDDVGDTNASN
jgi:UbiD family decarboxylase